MEQQSQSQGNGFHQLIITSKFYRKLHPVQWNIKCGLCCGSLLMVTANFAVKIIVYVYVEINKWLLCAFNYL